MPVFSADFDTSSLKKGAAEAKAALEQVGTAADNVGKKLNDAGKKGSDGLSKAEKAAYNVGASLGKSLRSLAVQIAALVGVYKTLDTVVSSIKRGFDFRASLEASEIAIASVVAATNNIADAQGRALAGQEKFNAAQAISKDLMQEIQVLGLKSTATFESLADGVAGIIAPATKAGVALAELPKFAVAAAQAMTTMKIPVQQMRTEIEAILTGNINRTQDILATNLGITKEMVLQWREAGTLTAELEKRFEAFVIAGDAVADSWGGLVGNMQDALDYLTGQAGGGLFEKAKQAYRELLDLMVSTEGQVGVGKDFENILGWIREIQDEIGDRLLALTREFIDYIKELNKPENLAEFKKSLQSSKETLSDIVSFVKLLGGLAGTIVQGWMQLPSIVQEMGIIGAIAFGSKGRAVLAGIGLAVGAINKLVDSAQSIGLAAEVADYNGLGQAVLMAEILQKKVAGGSAQQTTGTKTEAKTETQALTPAGASAPDTAGLTLTPAITTSTGNKKGNKSGGTSSIDSARESLRKLREEIAELAGDSTKIENSLEGKYREIEKMGKAAGLSATEIAGLKEQYTKAFQKKTLEEFNEEMLRLEGNSTALRQLEIDKTVQEWEAKFRAAGLSAEETADKISLLKTKMAEQQEIENLEVAADFYKELGELSGQYGKDIEYQNELITKQAKAWEQAGIPLEDIAERVRLMQLEISTDPFDGAYRGLLQFTAEYGNSAEQWESLTKGFAQDFESTTKEIFDDFLDTGELSFDSLGDLFKQLLKDMAYQALINPIVVSTVSGAASLLGGSTWGSSSLLGAGADFALSYGASELIGATGLASGLAASLNSWAASTFSSVFAPTAAEATVNAALASAAETVGAETAAALGYTAAGTTTLTSLLGTAALGAGLGSLGYTTLGSLIGLPQNEYSGITSAVGGGLGTALGSVLLPGVGTVLGGALGSVIGGLASSLFGSPEEEAGVWMRGDIDLRESPDAFGDTVNRFDGNGQAYDSATELGGNGSTYGYNSNIGANAWDFPGTGYQTAQSLLEYNRQIVEAALTVGQSLQEGLDAFGLKENFIAALSEDPYVTKEGRWDGDAVSSENFEAWAASLQEEMIGGYIAALGRTDITPLVTAADGFAADTADEITTALANAFNYYDLGASIGSSIGEEYQEEFEAAAAARIVEAFQDIDFSSFNLKVDTSTFTGLQQAYAAMSALDTVKDTLEELFDPASQLETALATATTQFDGWISNLQALGWEIETISELESQRAAYLREYESAITRSYEQDYQLRYMALMSGSGSSEYTLQSLLYSQENELSSLAETVGKDHNLYAVAELLQKAEYTQQQISLLEAELEQAEAAQTSARQSALQSQLTTMQSQLSTLKSQLSTAKQLASTWEGILSALEDTRRELWTGEDNPVGTSFEEAAKAFEEAYMAALGGDTDAMSEAQSLATELLSQGQQSLASQAEYTGLFYDVDQKLKALQNIASDEYKAAQREADLLQAQVDAVNSQTDTLSSQISNLSSTVAAASSTADVAAIKAQLATLQTALAGYLSALSQSTIDPELSAGTTSATQQGGSLATGASSGSYAGTPHTYVEGYTTYTQAGQALYIVKEANGAVVGGKISGDMHFKGQSYNPFGLNYGIYGSRYASEYDLLKAKAESMNAGGGETRWSASTVQDEILRQFSSVEAWYNAYGKAEGFASGGITPVNAPFWVGEEGPELMMAPQSYGVLNHDASMALMDRDTGLDESLLRQMVSYLRQLIVKTDQAAYYTQKTYSLQRMWDAEGLPQAATA